MSYTLIMEWLGNGASGHSSVEGYETHRFSSLAKAETAIIEGSLKTTYDFFIERMQEFLPKEGLEAKVAGIQANNAKPLYCLIEDNIDDKWRYKAVAGTSQNVIVKPYGSLAELRNDFASGPKYGGKLRIATRIMQKWVKDMYISLAEDMRVNFPDDILKLNKTRREK